RPAALSLDHLPTAASKPARLPRRPAHRASARRPAAAAQLSWGLNAYGFFVDGATRELERCRSPGTPRSVRATKGGARSATSAAGGPSPRTTLRRGSRSGVSAGLVGGRAARRALLGQGGELLQRLRCAAARVGVVDDQGLPVGTGDLEVLVVELEFADLG